jgi:hypothetical protein
MNSIALLFTTGIVLVFVRSIGASLSTKHDRPFQLLTILFVVTVFVFSVSPAIAAPYFAALGASDEALTEEQKAIDQNLRTSPEGTLYTGLETVTSSSTNQPDDAEIREAILKAIHSDVRSDVRNLTVEVTSGSVLINGRVENRKTAQSVIDQIKKISGVREIAFSLGLKERAEKVNT